MEEIHNSVMQIYVKHWVIVPCCIKHLHGGYRHSKVKECQQPTSITGDVLCLFSASGEVDGVHCLPHHRQETTENLGDYLKAAICRSL